MSAPPPLPPPPWLAADAEAMRQALAEAKASEKLAGPALFDYVFDLGRWLQERIFGALEKLAPWSGRPIVEQVALYAAIGGAALAVLTVLVVAVRRWRAARRRDEGVAVALPVSAAAATPSGDAAWWQAELQRRISQGRLRPALEAAWWWTARRLDPPGLDASWTSGELLGASGAAALRAPLRRLDRQLWGGAPLRRDEVQAVVDELAGASR